MPPSDPWWQLWKGGSSSSSTSNPTPSHPPSEQHALLSQTPPPASGMLTTPLDETLKHQIATSTCSAFLRVPALGLAGMKEFAQAYSTNTNITALVFFKNHLGTKGAEILAGALKEGIELDELNLGKTGLTHEGLCALASRFEHLRGPHKIWLFKNHLDHRAGEVLASAINHNPHIREINVGDNDIGTQGIDNFVKSLRPNSSLKNLQLKQINLSPGSEHALVQLISDHASLETLNLRANRIGQRACMMLAQAVAQRTRPIKIKLSGKEEELYNDALSRTTQLVPPSPQQQQQQQQAAVGSPAPQLDPSSASTTKESSSGGFVQSKAIGHINHHSPSSSHASAKHSGSSVGGEQSQKDESQTTRSLEEELEHLRVEVGRLRQREQDASSQKEAEAQERAKLKEQLKTATQDLAAMALKVQSAETAAAEAEQRLADFGAEQTAAAWNEVLDQATAAEKHSARLAQELSNVQAALKKAEVERRETIQEKEAVLDDLGALRTSHAHLEEQLLQREVVVHRLSAEMEKLQGELQEEREGRIAANADADAVEKLSLKFERLLNIGMSKGVVEDMKRAVNKEKNIIKGAQGHLFRGEFAGIKVALKQVPVYTLPGGRHLLGADTTDLSEDERRLVRELQALVSVRHPHIVPFLGTCHSEESLYILMPWAERGSLYAYLHEEGHVFEREQKLRVCMEVASAMEFLHFRNIAHRDLKSANVLLSSRLSAQVCDFGLSAVQSPDASHLSHVLGTPVWASPEQLAKGTVRMSTDVFSFGCVMWEVMFAIKPWHHKPFPNQALEDVIRDAYKRQEYLPVSETINGISLDTTLKELLGACFRPHGERTTFQALRVALQKQHEAASAQRIVSEEEQKELLHGADNAAWKFSPNVLERLRERFISIQGRRDVLFCQLHFNSDLNDRSILEDLLHRAGGQLIHEDPLRPCDHTVAAALVVQCEGKNIAFNSVINRDKARFRGKTTDPTSKFWPKYKLQNGKPADPNDSAVLSRVTGWPDASKFAYSTLDDTLLRDNACIRVQRAFHGVTSFDAVVGILRGDFAILQATDLGWYGVGLYYTPDFDYALAYTKACPGSKAPQELQHLELDPSKDYHIVLACDVVYGNPYPVCDGRFGDRPLMPGHDAHAVVVDFTSGNMEDAVAFSSYQQWDVKHWEAKLKKQKQKQKKKAAKQKTKKKMKAKGEGKNNPSESGSGSAADDDDAADWEEAEENEEEEEMRPPHPVAEIVVPDSSAVLVRAVLILTKS